MGPLPLDVSVTEPARALPGIGAARRSDVDSLIRGNVVYAIDPAHLRDSCFVASASDHADRLQRLVDAEACFLDIPADSGKRTPAGERDYPSRPTGHLAYLTFTLHQPQDGAWTNPAPTRAAGKGSALAVDTSLFHSACPRNPWLPWAKSAAQPATCGVAMLVPLKMA